MQEVVLLICAYLIGSIPSAVWISQRFFGIDIRDYGSGNAGATNTFRVLGKKWGTIVMIMDVVKGFLATSLFVFLPKYVGADVEIVRVNFMIGLGLSAVLGHVFPIWANFKGGKGVATLFGMVIAIQPLVAFCCAGVFLIVLYLTRFVSLSSMLAGIAFAVFILFIFQAEAQSYRIFSIVVALLIILTHQKNISRLIHGTESKVPILKYRDKRRKQKEQPTNSDGTDEENED